MSEGVDVDVYTVQGGSLRGRLPPPAMLTHKDE